VLADRTCTPLSVKTDRAVAVCLDYLRYAGIDWTPHPTEEETRREYEYIWKTLGNRTIEALIDLPLMNDPASLATMDVLTKPLAAGWYTDVSLACMTICRAVSLSLERGNCDASCFAYSNFQQNDPTAFSATTRPDIASGSSDMNLSRGAG